MKEKRQPGSDPAQALRVAAYIRVSTFKDEQEDSYELQERYFTNLLEANPTWVSVGVYSDYAVSATNVSNRTGFKRLMRHCSEGKIDRIISKSISRFARNTRDLLMAIRILNESGVTIFFEKENIDTADKTSEFIMTTLGALAQEESRSISENIRWGFQKRFPLGEARNIDIYGYAYAEGSDAFSVTESGYRFRNLTIVEEEAEVVRRIFDEVVAGNTYISIARRLNRDHIPAPDDDENCRGWTGDRVREVVERERYAGDILLQKVFTIDFLTHKLKKNEGEMPKYYVKNHHQSIVDRELFEKTQEIVQEKKTGITPERNTYPLSGRLVCASCGHRFHTYNRKSHPIWVCGTVRLNNGSGVCHMPRIYEEQILQMLRKAFILRFDLTGKSTDVVLQIRKKLEEIHEGDDLELKRHEAHRHMIEMEEKNDADGKIMLMRELKHLEEYWAMLEEDYEVRKEAIIWLRTLTGDKERNEKFLYGATHEYIKAFILSIVVYSPYNYRVRWFDDVITDVEMSTNVEDHRRINLANKGVKSDE